MVPPDTFFRAALLCSLLIYMTENSTLFDSLCNILVMSVLLTHAVSSDISREMLLEIQNISH